MLTCAHTHKPHDRRREELSRSHRLFLNLPLGGNQITMFIHSGEVGIFTRICDLDARLPGANAWATHPGDQEETCGRENTCNRRT